MIYLYDSNQKEVHVGDIVKSVRRYGHTGEVTAVHVETPAGVWIQRIDSNTKSGYVEWDWVEDGYIADPYFIPAVKFACEYQII